MAEESSVNTHLRQGRNDIYGYLQKEGPDDAEDAVNCHQRIPSAPQHRPDDSQGEGKEAVVPTDKLAANFHQQGRRHRRRLGWRVYKRRNAEST